MYKRQLHEPVAIVTFLIDYRSNRDLSHLLDLCRDINHFLGQECVMISCQSLVCFVDQSRASQGYCEDFDNFVGWVKHGQNFIESVPPRKPGIREAGPNYPYLVVIVGNDVQVWNPRGGAITLIESKGELREALKRGHDYAAMAAAPQRSNWYGTE